MSSSASSKTTKSAPTASATAAASNKFTKQQAKSKTKERVDPSAPEFLTLEQRQLAEEYAPPRVRRSKRGILFDGEDDQEDEDDQDSGFSRNGGGDDFRGGRNNYNSKRNAGRPQRPQRVNRKAGVELAKQKAEVLATNAFVGEEFARKQYAFQRYIKDVMLDEVFAFVANLVKESGVSEEDAFLDYIKDTEDWLSEADSMVQSGMMYNIQEGYMPGFEANGKRIAAERKQGGSQPVVSAITTAPADDCSTDSE